MNDDYLKEYQIIHQIPGTINLVDSFIKEEYRTFYEDIGNGEKKEVQNIILPVYGYETAYEGGFDDDGFIKICEWFFDRDEINALIKMGYIEEYRDNTLVP